MPQVWLNANGKHLQGVTYWPSGARSRCGVLLVAGLSQPKSDLGYFMSKLSRLLKGSGAFVLQLDPAGHGDSSGDLADVDLASLREDIEAGIRYVSLRTDAETFCVGRGLTAVVMAEFLGGGCLSGAVAIDPYRLNGGVVSELFGLVRDEPYEVADLLQEDTDTAEMGKAFFRSMGADLNNLRGQTISGKLILQLAAYDPDAILSKNTGGACLVLRSSKPSWDDSERSLGRDSLPQLSEYRRFPEDPMLLYDTMTIAHQWIIRRIRACLT